MFFQRGPRVSRRVHCSCKVFFVGWPNGLLLSIANATPSISYYSTERENRIFGGKGKFVLRPIRRILQNLVKIRLNCSWCAKGTKKFRNTKFSWINRIISWVFWKFSNRLPADLAENSAEFCRKPVVEAKKLQKILTWPTLNLYITITHISF
jgi:hypothetical protein